jgi:hypothetical protein
MPDKGYSDELQRALARPDAEKLIRQIDAYAAHIASGGGDWPEEFVDDFCEILDSHRENVEKALAYVVLGANRSDDPDFVNLLGCGTLEDILRNPTDETLDRIVAEARRSPRFRWMLNSPYKVAVSETAWNAIEPFRQTGPHEEPALDTMPLRSS